MSDRSAGRRRAVLGAVLVAAGVGIVFISVAAWGFTPGVVTGTVAVLAGLLMIGTSLVDRASGGRAGRATRMAVVLGGIVAGGGVTAMLLGGFG